MEFALNQVNFGYDSLEEAFPDVDPGVEPLGSRVIVQIRRTKSKTVGGIILPDEIRETDRWNTQIAKVVAYGPLAFHNRNTGKPWPEGDWVSRGDYVRVPKHGGDKWTVTHEDQYGKDEIMFLILDDLNLIARVKDPLSVKAYL